MRRTNVYLTEGQHDELSRRAEETGLKLSELIRRAIDRYLDEVPTRSSGPAAQSGKTGRDEAGDPPKGAETDGTSSGLDPE